MNFPKTLEIRNTAGGAIWQLYHVQTQKEIDFLTKVSRGNGFYSQTVVDFDGEEETFTGWRNDVKWTKAICPLCNTKPCVCVKED
jgi:hypothetical protein